MRFAHAITRQPGPDLGAGLTTAGLGPPSFELARAQHGRYVAELEGAGLEVEVLPPLSGFPDAYFVEDAAVVLPEVAVLTRPGAAARRGEVDAIAAALARHRPLVSIVAPGTVDGGDVLVVRGRAFIGVSGRTNRSGAEQLGAVMARHGLGATLVDVGAGLHLKSGVNAAAPDTLLLAAGVDAAPFTGFAILRVPEAESYAANVLRVNDTVLVPEGFPGTRELLDRAGLRTVALDVSEIRRMDGGLTCMSLRF